MGSAQAPTAGEIIAGVRYQLRDQNSKQYTDDELLTFLNDWSAAVYKALVYDQSEIVRTGSGTITTVAGTETYSLSAVGVAMGDFWAPHRVWIAGYEPLDLGEEDDRYDYEQTDGTFTRRQPESFYIAAGSMGFVPVPDAIYTVRVKYYPEFVPLTSVASTMPYRNLFNQQIAYGVQLTAKARQMQNAAIETSIMQLHADIAHKIVSLRSKNQYRFTPEI